MAAAANVKFIDRSYGKASVKMLHVVRDGNVHSIKEYEVTTLITLASDKDFTHVRFFFCQTQPFVLSVYPGFF